MKTLIGRNSSQIAMKGDETMNTCKHERIKSVNCRIFCVSCGEELPLDYLFVKHEQAAEKPENKQETQTKRGRKRNG